MRATKELEVSRIFPPKEGSTPMVTTSVRIPATLSDAIRLIAEKETRSQSEVIHHLLRYAVQEWENESESPRKSNAR